MSHRDPVACPKCQKPLKIRDEYLGRDLACKHCRHTFSVSPTGTVEPPASPPVEPTAVEKVDVECPSCRRTLRVRRPYLGHTVSCRHCQHPFVAGTIRGGGATGEAGDRYEEIEARRRELELEVGRLAERLGGVETRFDEARFEGPVGDESLVQAAIERDELRRDLADLGATLSSFRREFDAFRREAETSREADRRETAVRVEAGGDSARLGLELEALRAELERRLRDLEDPEVLRPAVVEAIDRLREGDRSLRQAIEAGAEAGRAGLATLEAARVESARRIDALGVSIDARFREIGEDLDGLRDRVGRPASLDRLDAIEADRDALRRELADFRREQDRLIGDLVARSERSRAEVEALRAELESPRSAPAPVPPAFNGHRPDPTPGPSFAVTPAEATGSGLDRLAQDLILDRLSRSGESEERPGIGDLGADLATAPVKFGVRVPTARGPSSAPAEYQQLGAQYHGAMNRRDLGEAIASARRLVAYAGESFGDRSIELSLWLRNLGVALSLGGQHAEARATLHRSLEICEGHGEAGRVAHAICLIDLTQSYLLGGDRRQASTLGQQALAILKELGLAPNNPLLVRARECLARIRAAESNPPTLGTISIST